MAKILICTLVSLSILLASIQPTHAIISETADLAISTASGLLQTDDKKLEDEIISGLQNPTERENLINYVAKTRPLIVEKTQSFNDSGLTILLFLNRIPLIGGATVSATLNAYIWKFESDLADEADTPTLKKFAELREHNIDAGQELFELSFDVLTKTYDKDTSSAVVYMDSGLLAMKGMQQKQRYESSAAAIATVLEYAGISMQPEDVGDILMGGYHGETKPNPRPQNVTNPNPIPQNINPPVQVNPPVQNSVAPSGPNWIKDENNVYLWNPQPNPNETITWSGSWAYDGDYRYASGLGVVTWYLNGEFEQQDEGVFIHGQRTGKFKHTFPSGQVVYSYWDNGLEIPMPPDIEEAVLTFSNYHDFITIKNYKAAYEILSDNQKQRVGDYEHYVAGFANTLSSQVEKINLIDSSENSRTYKYELTARDNVPGGVKIAKFAGEVTLIQQDGRWYIDFAKSSKIGEHIE